MANKEFRVKNDLIVGDGLGFVVGDGSKLINIGIPKATTVADGTNITWDTSLGNIGTLTLTGALTRTVAAPTHLAVGTYILHILQDATGSRTITTWNPIFKWPGGFAPTLTTSAGSRDIFSFVC